MTGFDAPQRHGLVSAVEFSRGEWVVTLACPPECTPGTCSNFGSLMVIGRGSFRTALEASAYREKMHGDDPTLIRLGDPLTAAPQRRDLR